MLKICIMALLVFCNLGPGRAAQFEVSPAQDPSNPAFETSNANSTPLQEPSIPQASSSSCDFYIQMEKKLQCDPVFWPEKPYTEAREQSKYLISYGHKYCLKFKASAEKSNDPQYKKWVQDTMYCLQKILQDPPISLKTCQDLEQFAFNSHPLCYEQSGFCRLSLKAKKSIAEMVKVRDLMTNPKRNLRQILQTGLACVF